MTNSNTQKVVMLVLRVLTMAMAAVSIGLALVGTTGFELYGIVLGIGLFALAASIMIEPGRP
jgi:hypothetical protein